MHNFGNQRIYKLIDEFVELEKRYALKDCMPFVVKSTYNIIFANYVAGEAFANFLARMDIDKVCRFELKQHRQSLIKAYAE